MTTTCESLVAMDRGRMGRFGEAVCKSIMASSGVHYIPLCEIENGSAPMAVGSDTKTVLPDFDVFGDDVYAYIDAKVKSRCVRWKKSGQLRHGINRINYDAYQRMGLMQRKTCGLLLVELMDDFNNWSGTVMTESFVGLGKPLFGCSDLSHMVFWPRDRFAVVGRFSPDELVAIAKREKQVDMSALLKATFGPPPKQCPDAVHLDPANYLDQPDARRPGWITTTCRKCGKWLGNRPAKEVSA